MRQFWPKEVPIEEENKVWLTFLLFLLHELF